MKRITSGAYALKLQDSPTVIAIIAKGRDKQWRISITDFCPMNRAEMSKLVPSFMGTWPRLKDAREFVQKEFDSLMGEWRKQREKFDNGARYCKALTSDPAKGRVIEFISRDYDVRDILESIGYAVPDNNGTYSDDYAALFVQLDKSGADYFAVWGINSQIPYNNLRADMLYFAPLTHATIAANVFLNPQS